MDDADRPGGGQRVNYARSSTGSAPSTTPPITADHPLEVLAAEINLAHHEARDYAGKAIERALQAGDLLLTVKSRLAHGEFGPWCAANCPDISRRTIQNYMRVARELPAEKRIDAHLGLNQALRLIASAEEEDEEASSADLLSRQPDDSHHNDPSATATPTADSPAEQAKRKVIDEWKCCVSLVAHIGGRMHEAGLELPDNISEDDFIAVGKALANLESAWQFYKFTKLSPEQKARLSEWQP